MRIRIVVLVVLVAELVACGQPAEEVRGRARPVPSSTGVSRCELLGDTPVVPGEVVVKL
ncbi:hypothetical protein [Amycolatopsis rifamycinica]|uniref:hypothetical protein n=1 Tax=Amycolatopsis rifamycinica TaxID=287986 RepID=UPI00068FAB14|nr:hypothetical protein [Amycolatopsis rifamycinica]